MKNLTAIVYISSAVQLSTAKVESILLDARQYNHQHGITGVLLYTNSSFLQYFEGQSDEVSEVFTRIKNSTSHTEIKPLLVSNISQRVFSDWGMGCTKVQDSEILALSTAEWVANEKKLENQASASPGISLLKTFWLASQI